MTDHFQQPGNSRTEIYQELAQLRLIDPHTHINPHSPASTTLADLLGYHYYTELAHSAGMPKSRIEDKSIGPKELVERLVGGLAPLENTVQYSWLIAICKMFFGFDEDKLHLNNWEALYDRSEAVMSSAQWPDMVLDQSNVEAVFLTNDFDDDLAGFDSDRYIPCLRTDDLVFHLADPEVRGRLAECSGIELDGSLSSLRASLRQRFEHFVGRGARACAISLPPNFTPTPVADGRASTALDAVLRNGLSSQANDKEALGRRVFWTLAELCDEFGLPFDLMIGVNRKVYPEGVFQGQDLYDSRVSLIQYRELFNAFPDVKFPVSVLASVTNQELVSYAWIFPNVYPNGHWWYSNTPSTITHDLAARLEAVPRTKMIGYYSDAYKLEFVWPKFDMYRKRLAGVLADQFVADQGWSIERAVELGRQVLKDNTEEIFPRPDKTSSDNTHAESDDSSSGSALGLAGTLATAGSVAAVSSVASLGSLGAIATGLGAGEDDVESDSIEEMEPAVALEDSDDGEPDLAASNEDAISTPDTLDDLEPHKDLTADSASDSASDADLLDVSDSFDTVVIEPGGSILDESSELDESVDVTDDSEEQPDDMSDLTNNAASGITTFDLPSEADATVVDENVKAKVISEEVDATADLAEDKPAEDETADDNEAEPIGLADQLSESVAPLAGDVEAEVTDVTEASPIIEAGEDMLASLDSLPHDDEIAELDLDDVELIDPSEAAVLDSSALEAELDDEPLDVGNLLSDDDSDASNEDGIQTPHIEQLRGETSFSPDEESFQLKADPQTGEFTFDIDTSDDESDEFALVDEVVVVDEEPSQSETTAEATSESAAEVSSERTTEEAVANSEVDGDADVEDHSADLSDLDEDDAVIEIEATNSADAATDSMELGGDLNLQLPQDSSSSNVEAASSSDSPDEGSPNVLDTDEFNLDWLEEDDDDEKEKS
ncbi:Glucuronate isomerase [Neorhodopirellula lusitana]|uniref:Glucuronate isomerase n=1 Tax=Neorhodopirellula lusitana TaxID=445327 RepID=A0ABY1Q2G2_9BACT|nr:glucuronate isomerase [Neorhodopirellula lusitana]SMP56106.1 Glucuronate isomerase [Neorhodopirellula lusitana]